MAKRMGRPPKEIDKVRFEEMCAIQCTEEEIAAVFEVNASTLCDWCKRTYGGKTFSEVFAEKRQVGFYSLRSSKIPAGASRSPLLPFRAPRGKTLDKTDRQKCAPGAYRS